MDMDQAAVFFAGSILTALGFLVWICVIVLVNNIIHKYWKSWGWNWMSMQTQHPTRFMTDEELTKVAPHFEPEKK